jgi:hypothetical protein
VVRKILSEEVREEGEEVVGVHAFETIVYSKLMAKKITNILLSTRLTSRYREMVTNH